MRRLVVPLLAAALLGMPAPASASIDDCPQAVKDVRGTQPSNADVAAALHEAAVTRAVPEVLLRAIAYVESGWRQFNPDGTVVASTDAVCGLGIMQITATTYSDEDKVRLAEDYAFNVDQGAKILAEKWTASLATPPPTGAAPDDPDVVENWYYALCLYNGCGSDPTYPTKVANVVADPFRYAQNFTPLDPYWFTKPQDAKPDYVFPNAFQARYSPPGEFVFYDHTTGTVLETVQAPTHSLTLTPAPPIAYPAGTYGPDGPGVTCEQCGGWRLASGSGLIGRAHWTNTVTGDAQATMTWRPSLPRTGPYRVQAFVPSLAEGVATYRVDGVDVARDQAPVANAWLSLGDHTLSPGDAVVLGDSAATGGQQLAGDAMAFSGITALSLTTGRRSVTYGSATTLTARLTHAGSGLGGRGIRFYKRAVGTAAWTPIGTYGTSSDGTVSLAVKPTVNAEYTARYVSSTPAYTHAAVGVRRILVAPRVAATLSRTTVPRNTAVTVATSVAPNHRGRRIYLQRLVNGAWQNVTSAILSSTSRASFRVSRPGAGTFYYRTYLPAHGDHTTGTSARLTLRVT